MWYDKNNNKTPHTGIYVTLKVVFHVIDTYRPGDEETREQVPKTEEEGHDNSRNLMVRSQSHNHHSIHGEVGKAHEYEVVEIEELDCCPFKANHRVKEKSIDKGLNYNINCFYGHL